MTIPEKFPNKILKPQITSYLPEKDKLFSPDTHANSLISYVFTYLIHSNMTSQTVIYPKRNPNKKIINVGPEFVTLVP